MKRKPEEQPQRSRKDKFTEKMFGFRSPEDKGISLQEHYRSREPSFLMNHWYIKAEQKRRKRFRFIYAALLIFAMIAVLAWAFSR